TMRIEGGRLILEAASDVRIIDPETGKLLARGEPAGKRLGLVAPMPEEPFLVASRRGEQGTVVQRLFSDNPEVGRDPLAADGDDKQHGRPLPWSPPARHECESLAVGGWLSLPAGLLTLAVCWRRLGRWRAWSPWLALLLLGVFAVGAPWFLMQT